MQLLVLIKLLEINPKDAQAFNNKGIAMAEMGNIQDAAECYDKAIEADPKMLHLILTKEYY